MQTQEDIDRFESMDAAHRGGHPVARPAMSPVEPCPLGRWVAVELRDVRGNPVPDAAYVLTLPDGSKRQGHLDSRGFSLEHDIPVDGQCQVTFPDIRHALPA